MKKIDQKANMCADYLARLGYDWEDEGKLWLNPPISVIPILGIDNGY